MAEISITNQGDAGFTVRALDREFIVSGDELDISDGYHTMSELYEHRFALYVALCRTLEATNGLLPVWRSTNHSDGSKYDGWFVLGINKEAGQQITYHLPMSWWTKTDFAETRDCAPEYDGHTSKDVLVRLEDI